MSTCFTLKSCMKGRSTLSRTDGTREASLVDADIKTYASYSTYSINGPKIPIDGIFFDEMSDDTSKVDVYKAYAETARTAIGSSAFVRASFELEDGQRADREVRRSR